VCGSLCIFVNSKTSPIHTPNTSTSYGHSRIKDGKRPDGLTLIPWQHGKLVTWDITVAHMARSNGAEAEQAAGRKSANYDLLVQTGRLFQPIAAEMLGPLNESCIGFFSELGRKIASVSGDS